MSETINRLPGRPVLSAHTPAGEVYVVGTTAVDRISFLSFGFPGAIITNDRDVLFAMEKAAFLAMLPALQQQQYAGRHVAVHGGQVVDADANYADLVRRFFDQFGDQSVYIGYVGNLPEVNQLSPFSL